MDICSKNVDNKKLRFFSLRYHLIMAKWHATPCRNKIEARKQGELRMILWLTAPWNKNHLAGQVIFFIQHVGTKLKSGWSNEACAKGVRIHYYIDSTR